MSKLVGGLNTAKPVIDKRLFNKLVLLTTVELKDTIIRVLNLGFWGIAEQLDSEGMLIDIPRVNCIVTLDGSFSIILDEEQQGCHMSLVIYPIQKWENANYTELKMLTCVVEELCHHFWNIEDEVKVSYKVLEVIRRIFPYKDVKMANLFNIKWLEEQNKGK